MNLPKDPLLLKSCLNTFLRDEYDSLEALVEDRDLSLSDLLESLRQGGLQYDEKANRVI